MKMVTGIKTLSQQQVVSNMGTLNGITTQIPPQEAPVKRASDSRRSNKPIMEKRRRARINNCLNELKTLILDAMKKDPARHSKLEKADILEMTVKYLENLQRQQAAMSQASDPNIVNKFKAGFSECANEVGRFPGIEPQVKRRLLQHLSNCLNGVKTETVQHMPSQQQQQQQQQQPQQPSVQVHILPSPPSSPEQEHSHSHNNTPMSHITATSNGYYLTNGSGNGVQLIPTKLSNGNIAFVLPQTIPSATPLPMLVPIPSRTASTGSATSSASSNYNERVREHSTSPYNAPPSPANSYEPMDCSPAHQNIPSHQHQQQMSRQHQQQLLIQQQQRSFSPSAPISLVMRKTNYEQQIKEEEKHWRPW